MARTNKTGLDYFSFDVDFFGDEKIELVSAKYDLYGEIIPIKLLCRIYRNGYYLQWDEDQAMLFAKRAGYGITKNIVDDVIQELIKRDFFSDELFKSFSILTSRGIQTRYIEACRRRKSVQMINEYLLIDPYKIDSKINADIISINDNINLLNVDNNPQKKGKEKERKRNGKEISRTEIFEVFFFKNFIRPHEEVEAFINHYEKTGWKTKSGTDITNVIAAAKTWEQKEHTPNMPAKLLDKWHVVYNVMKEAFPNEAPKLLKFKPRKIENGKLFFQVPDQSAVNDIENEEMIIRSLSMAIRENFGNVQVEYELLKDLRHD